jgi:hypothetical protein
MFNHVNSMSLKPNGHGSDAFLEPRPRRGTFGFAAALVVAADASAWYGSFPVLFHWF